MTGYTGSDKVLNIPAECEGAKVIRIQRLAFTKMRDIVSVTIPDSVTYIGPEAFYICPALKELHLPKNLKIIGKNAFNYCTSLTSVIIPDGTLHMDRHAFYDCSALESISIPDSVGFFGADALHNSPKVSVICSKNSYAWKYATENGFATAEP